MKNALEQAFEMVQHTPVYNNASQWAGRFGVRLPKPSSLVSPVPESHTLNDPQKLWYVGHNQAMEEQARLPSAPSVFPKKIEYPSWITNAPTLASIPQQRNQPIINIPDSQTQGMHQVPFGIAQTLLNAFNDINEATNAARVLHHPKSQTFTPDEVAKMGRESWNYGENASYKTQADAPNKDGSIDRGLMRINSNTFNGMLQDPFWRKVMAKYGITHWDDMLDQEKNARMGRLILTRTNWNNVLNSINPNPSYGAWYAAPLDLRQRTNRNLAKKK